MKFDGSRFSPLKFSSLKKDMMWFVWRQKFMVSCSTKYQPQEFEHIRIQLASGLALRCPRLP